MPALSTRELLALAAMLEPVAASGAASLDFQQVRVVQKAVEDGNGSGVVTENLAEILQRPVAGEDSRAEFIAAHQYFEEALSGGLRQGAQAEIVDDEQFRFDQLLNRGLALAGDFRFGKVHGKVEGAAVAHGIALIDGTAGCYAARRR